MYADNITDSMKGHRRDRAQAGQTDRLQRGAGVDPQPLRKKIADILDQVYSEADDTDATVAVGGSGRNSSRGGVRRRAGPAVSAGHHRRPGHGEHAAGRTGGI